MNQFGKIALFLCALTLLTGCGGGGGGEDEQIPSRIDILAEAPGHGDGQGVSQLTGFAEGHPAFLSYTDATRWTLLIPGIDTADLPTTDYENAFLVAFDNGIVVGGYDDGTFVYRKVGLDWVDSTFTGFESPVLDATTGTLIGELSGGGFATVDIATGTQTPITLPAGAALYFAKNKWLVYGNGGSTFVRNVQTAVEWEEQQVAGDTNSFPYAVNKNGGVIGNSGDGTAGRAVYWQPGTGTPTVIDSFAGATVEPGWISPDGTKAIVNVFADSFRTYLYANGTKYTVADIENGNAVTYLNGFNDDGQFGFGLTDPSGDPESSVAVQITYK